MAKKRTTEKLSPATKKVAKKRAKKRAAPAAKKPAPTRKSKLPAKPRAKKPQAKKPAPRRAKKAAKKPRPKKTPAPSLKPPVGDAGYEAKKEAARQRSARAAHAGRDIGGIPIVADPERKARAAGDFLFFCEAYFPERFCLAWSDDHLKAIERIQTAVLSGGLFALAMPRGSGKTALAEAAALWAALNGHHEMIALIGATEGHGDEILDSVKMEIETNPLLDEDYPEACYPIACLDGIMNRAAGQLCEGDRTRIKWTGNTIILPSIRGSKSSAVILKSVALLGRVRGIKYTRPGGRIVRPSFVIPDDPQTDESAVSHGPRGQNAKRLKVLAGAVLGLAGPGKKIAGVMPCTVIDKGDMADTILDREKHPEWNGLRTKMMKSFPTNEKLWDQYAAIRAEGLRAEDGGAAATKFYRENRDAMDAGAVVSWPARFNVDELSAIQNAMNLKISDEDAFFAEYQNEPNTNHGEDVTLTADEVAARVNGRRRGSVPRGCNWITMFVDVHDGLLYWMAIAWESDFTGHVLDYGSFPDQGRQYYSLREAKKTLTRAFPRAEAKAAIYAGLVQLLQDAQAKEWRRDDGAAMRIDRILIDAGYVATTVYQACRRIGSPAILPSKGVGITASQKPMIAMKRKKGELYGDAWMIPSVKGTRELRHVRIDTNTWKTFGHARLGISIGDPGALDLFGVKASDHRLLSEHLTAEYRVTTEGQGRTVHEWKLPTHRPDNHWLDCLVGCAVGASMLGARLPGQATPAKKVTKKSRSTVSYL